MRPLALVLLLATGCSSPPPPPPGPTPSAGHFTLECTRHAVGAYDAARGLIAGSKLNCAAHVADHAGVPIENVSVSFFAEAGRVRAEAPTSSAGDVSALYETALPLPHDVEPGVFTWTPINDTTHTGVLLAPEWMQPFNWVEDPVALAQVPPAMRAYTLREPRRPDPIRLKPETGRFMNNPRDNLVTMIAVVEGAEAFTDDNANGTFDVGEAFVDLTEPFVDANDDGTWESGEEFIDTNGNRMWDGKNGTWDAKTKIWTQERVLWTGEPAPEDMLDAVPGVAGHRKSVSLKPTPLALRCPLGATYCATAGDPTNSYRPVAVTLYVADPWFNSIVRSTELDACTVGAQESPPLVSVNDFPQTSGVRLTYPAGDIFSFNVGDARDPQLPVAQQTPRRSPAAPFQRVVNCVHTTAATDGVVFSVQVPISGTVE